MKLSTLITAIFVAAVTANEANVVGHLERRQASTTITACAGFNNIEGSCATKTSGFTLLSFTQQASCLCTSSGTYAGGVFDTAWASCLAYFATASPAYYTSIGGTAIPTNPCGRLAVLTGGVGGNATTGAASSTSSSATASSTSMSSSSNLIASITSSAQQTPSTSATALTTAGSTTVPTRSGSGAILKQPRYWILDLIIGFAAVML